MASFLSVCFDQFPARSVEWLWRPYLARGKLTLLDGEPGVGKSIVTADLAARLSRGGPLPDGTPGERPFATLFLNAEDDLDDVLWPRLAAAGADLQHIHAMGGLRRGIIDEPQTQLPRDLPLLELAITTTPADLVVIDPLEALFPVGGAARANRLDCKALLWLAALAVRTRAAILGVVRNLGRAPGASAAVGAVRAALRLWRDPDDPDVRVLALAKSTVGPPAPSLALRLRESSGAGSVTIEWMGPRGQAERDDWGLDGCFPPDHARRSAEAWLKAALAQGPQPATRIIYEAHSAGHAKRTLSRAKQRLGVISEQVYRDDHCTWYWHDPAVPSANKAAQM